MTVENILALSFRGKKEALSSMNSEELTELHDEVSDYITKNGNNDTLQWLLDKTFEVSYLRGIEEKNPGYSCVGYDTFDKVITLKHYGK